LTYSRVEYFIITETKHLIILKFNNPKFNNPKIVQDIDNYQQYYLEHINNK